MSIYGGRLDETGNLLVLRTRRGAELFLPVQGGGIGTSAFAGAGATDVDGPGCNSTVVLMGCSSGKLDTVDRKHLSAPTATTLFSSHYEPEGIALSYLMAGSPCVVANLWDVTDRDIDRYCEALLRTFLVEHKDWSLARCAAEARSSCKLKRIVGLAPVCYGLPVRLRKS